MANSPWGWGYGNQLGMIQQPAQSAVQQTQMSPVRQSAVVRDSEGATAGVQGGQAQPSRSGPTSYGMGRGSVASKLGGALGSFAGGSVGGLLGGGIGGMLGGQSRQQVAGNMIGTIAGNLMGGPALGAIMGGIGGQMGMEKGIDTAQREAAYDAGVTEAAYDKYGWDLWGGGAGEQGSSNQGTEYGGDPASTSDNQGTGYA